MSILKCWVITCDCEECCEEYAGVPSSILDSRQETFFDAAHVGWGFIRLVFERGESPRKCCICPSCREKAVQELNPKKFFRDVFGHPTDLPDADILYTLSCGHQFTKLEPPPVDGKWECPACKRGWSQCGRVTELPAEFREANKKGSPELKRYDANTGY